MGLLRLHPGGDVPAAQLARARGAHPAAERAALREVAVGGHLPSRRGGPQRHNVDHPEEGGGPVDPAGGPLDHLDPLDEGQRHQQVGAEGVLGEPQGVVDGVAVDQDEQPGGVVHQEARAPDADVLVEAVAVGEEPRHGAQRLGQGPEAAGLEVPPPEHEDRGRRGRAALLVERGGRQRRVQQRVQGEVADLHGVLGAAGRRGLRGQGQQQRGGGGGDAASLRPGRGHGGRSAAARGRRASGGWGGAAAPRRRGPPR